MQRADEIASDPHRRVVAFGPAKSAGKTTFAVSAPGNKILLKYEPGIVSIPPGVDPKTLWVVEYPFDYEVINTKSDKWVRLGDAGQKILEDLEEINLAFHDKRDVKIDGVIAPLPDTIIMDGGTMLHDALISWICKVNGVSDPDQIVGDSGKKNKYYVWGKRMQFIMATIRKVFKLPCNAVLTAWETSDKDENGNIRERWPDIGGKIDYRATGMGDAGIYCFANRTVNGTRFCIRTVSDGVAQGVGVRGKYNLPEVIDVTIDPKKPVMPWDKLWGNIQAK